MVVIFGCYICVVIYLVVIYGCYICVVIFGCFIGREVSMCAIMT